MGLIDIDATGLPFTWYNKQMINEAIIEQIDRALSSYQWLQLYPTARLENLMILGSGHAHIL